MRIIDLLITSGMSSTITLIGVFTSQHLTRKSSKETNILREREEMYRMFRYGIDLVIKEKNIYGIDILKSLIESDLLQNKDEQIIDKLTTKLTYRTIGINDYNE